MLQLRPRRIDSTLNIIADAVFYSAHVQARLSHQVQIVKLCSHIVLHGLNVHFWLLLRSVGVHLLWLRRHYHVRDFRCLSDQSFKLSTLGDVVVPVICDLFDGHTESSGDFLVHFVHGVVVLHRLCKRLPPVRALARPIGICPDGRRLEEDDFAQGHRQLLLIQVSLCQRIFPDFIRGESFPIQRTAICQNNHHFVFCQSACHRIFQYQKQQLQIA